MAKVLSHSSTNPKMSMKVSTPVKGYAQGGIVPRGGMEMTPINPPAPAPVAATPAPNQGETDTRNTEGRGLKYSAFDTTMEAEAKAPTVGYGEAPKITAMPEIAKPGEIQYFGEEFKGEAEKLNQQRWDAYNRRAQNAAVRTGNVMPGQESAKTVYSEVPKMTPKAVQMTLPQAAPKAETPKVTPAKLTPDSLVNTTAMLSPQSKVLYKASDFIDYVKQRKKKGEV